jgi:hypothetical protein
VDHGPQRFDCGARAIIHPCDDDIGVVVPQWHEQYARVAKSPRGERQAGHADAGSYERKHALHARSALNEHRLAVAPMLIVADGAARFEDAVR